MRIDQTFKRRVRVIGYYEGGIGQFVTITDAETGEPITNVAKAVITLLPGEYNGIELTYHTSKDEQETVRLNAPELDLIAYESEPSQKKTLAELQRDLARDHAELQKELDRLLEEEKGDRS